MIGAIGAELMGAAVLGAAGPSRTGASGGVAGRTDGARGSSGANTGGANASGAAGGGGNVGAAGPAQGVDDTGAAGRAQGVDDTGAAGRAQNGAAGTAGKAGKGRFDRNDCQSCKNRTYQDGSGDPGVSFKAPTKINANQAASAVMGHEMEHVNRNKAKAASEGREVISQSVVLHNSICAECGKSYVSGGVTRTVTANKQVSDAYRVGERKAKQPGQALNAVA